MNAAKEVVTGDGDIIADFDGTFTKDNPDYSPACVEYLAGLFGIDKYEMGQLFIAGESKVRSNLQQYGWEPNGRTIAPVGDGLLFTRAAAKEALKKLPQNLLLDNNENYNPDAILDRMYQKVYPSTPASFKEDAKDVLRRLARTNKLLIVTNSDTKNVEGKLSLLEPDIRVPVIGNARKHMITDEWTTAVANGKEVAVPEEYHIPGLHRPALLRRKHYYDVLENKTISAVFGDVHELDLLVPAYLGILTILVKSPYTPDWDRKLYEEGQEGRFFADSLTAAAERIFSRDHAPVRLGK